MIQTGKRAAAEAAVALVRDGMTLGLGTGSTMRYALEAIGRRIRHEGLRLTGIPTSPATEQIARGLGISLVGFDSCTTLDLAIDGADEIEAGSLALIKGLGGALLREKIVAVNSRRFVVIADASKLVDRLGERAPVPVEVVPFGHETVARRLRQLGALPNLREGPDDRPYMTANGNLIYDCHGLGPITNPAALDVRISALAGVVTTGLFPLLATDAFVAEETIVSHLRPTVAHRQLASTSHRKRSGS